MKIFLLMCAFACVLAMAGGVASSYGQNAGQGTSAAPVTGDAVPGRLIKRVDPVYPGIAVPDQVDGDVVMRVTIAADGSVTNIRVTHGLPQLIRPAVHAVAQWQYEPYRVNGVATPIDTGITVHFKFARNTLSPSGVAQAEGQSAPLTAARPSLPPPPEGVIRISGRVMATMVEKKVDPVYPADAIAVDAQGSVLLLATIRKTGEVGEVQVVSGPQRFRDAAMDAVKQWHYQPYVVEGEAVDVQTTIKLDFAPPAH
jgi:TonB family protein